MSKPLFTAKDLRNLHNIGIVLAGQGLREGQKSCESLAHRIQQYMDLDKLKVAVVSPPLESANISAIESSVNRAGRIF